jgi:two-component system sensor histidine kinase AtoS
MRFLLLPSRSKYLLQGLSGWSLSLRQKFFLAFAALALGLTAGLLLIIESRQQVSIVREMEKRGVTIATHLAAVSTRSLLTYNFVALEQDVEKISRDRDVLYAIILDREGRVAAYSGHDEQQGMVLEDAVSRRAAQTVAPLVQRVRSDGREAEHYDIAVPVFIQESPERWGTVRVGLSLRAMQAEIRQTRLQVMLLGILGVLFSTATAAFLTRRISAPLRDLAEGTMAVARGELQHTIPVRTRDEIGVLATNFNDMTSELLKHRMALERTNDQLAKNVRELSILANYNANILKSLTSGLFTLDLDGCFETFNARAETITGWQGTEVQGQPYQQVFADNVPLLHVIEASRRHYTSLTAPRLEFCRRDGQRVPLALRTAMLQDHEARTMGLLAIFEDLSPLQTLERRLHRADRLAALGQMAAGIAHEIKNPLASIRTFTELVSRKHQDPNFVERFDRIVLREIDRVNLIVEELLELARPTRLQYTQVAVPSLLHRVVEAYSERLQQQHILLKTDFAAPIPALEADAEQLYRGFANIVLNAIEAMPMGGELRIACQPVPRSLFDVAVPGDREVFTEPPAGASVALDQYATDIEVVFSDTGEGIPAEQIDTLFTPFYTTKPKGTGLGLALTHKIIEEHRGHIRITSRVGHGTVVTVTLPPAR